MARQSIPFEVGAPVEMSERSFDGLTLLWIDKGFIVIGYTYWSDGFSILIADQDGNEKRVSTRLGIRQCSK